MADHQQSPGNGGNRNNHAPPPSIHHRLQQQQHRRNTRTHHGTSGGSNTKGNGSTGSIDHLATTREPKESGTMDLHCFKCEGTHRLEECTFFKELPISDRLTFAQRRGLCYGCFGVRHGATNCSFKKACGIDGCKSTHHRLLHKNNGPVDRTARPHTARSSQQNIALKMLRLDAFTAEGEAVPVNVLVDEGSDSTLFREGLARRLRLSGKRQTLVVEGVAEESSTHLNSEYLEIRLRTASGEIVTIQGSTMPSIAKPVAVTDWDKLRDRWSHLKDLPPIRICGGRIDILMGLDHAALTTSIESRFGHDDEPTASKTRLGWTVQGAVGNMEQTSSARVHRVVTSTEIGPQLLEQLWRFCDTEAFGTEFQGDDMSVENQNAVAKLEAEMEKLQTGYAAPVLWKEGVSPEILDGRRTAEIRLQNLRNKFRKTPEYETYYRVAMEKNFSEGYVRRLSHEEIDRYPTKYFLPHFGVPKRSGRPELRLVFDAAATSRGKCLNDFVTSGPALQNPLPAVIIRFSEGAIAWSADIGAMFSRIRLKNTDRAYHRFLWPEKNGTLSTCEMTRVTFGVSCSPYVAIRTTWRAADDAGPDLVEAAEAVRRGIYVDDYLASAGHIEDAVRKATGVRHALAEGDFHLGHWVANDTRVLRAVQATAEDGVDIPGTTCDLGESDPELVLGTVWKPSTDMLGFRVKITSVNYTRVGLLSKVAGLFYPLGTASPMTVKAKIKLRELSVKGLKWDDPVEGEERAWWEKYFQLIEQLREVEFSRCLFPDEDSIVRSELHTFADASEKACAASCYTRAVYQDGRVLVRHVKSTTKLSPLKTISVCKLELTAALMGSRLAKLVQTALRRKINARYFWTDSSTVRNWVRAVSSHYQVFVSHRIGEIQTLTEPDEWRFVPGRLNPADGATRSKLEEEGIPSWWLDGPPFLYDGELDWPKDIPWMAAKEELRSIHVHLNTATEEPPTPFDLKMIQISAQDIPGLTRLEGDFRHHVKRCQEEVYSDELKRLQQGKPIRSSSNLLPLTPFIDEDTVLCLGGHLARARLPYDVLHPPILPGKHPFARAIIRAFHESMHHVGTDFVLAHIRQHFWITSGRETVKQVRKGCIPCRRFQPEAALQMMADVHKARLGSHQPPFTYTSVYYFGPLDVIHGRGTAKRWGALFTCMVTRAVYVDVSISLSASDFLMVMRRFSSVYRKPAHMFSDNGTNLTGAKRLLRLELDRLRDDGALAMELKALGIEWFFQPAQTPHFGGSHVSLLTQHKNDFFPVF